MKYYNLIGPIKPDACTLRTTSRLVYRVRAIRLVKDNVRCALRDDRIDETDKQNGI